MTLWHPIEEQPGREHLEMLIREAFDSEIRSVEDLGESNFGFVYDVRLAGEPSRAIVKWHKFPGRGLMEKRQLEVLREHANTRVPEVYYYHPGTADLPFEAVVMEFIPGVQAMAVGEADTETLVRFAEEIIGILVNWHSVRNPQGYGEIDGPYYPRWLDYYGQRLETAYAEIIRPEYELPPVALDTAHASIRQVESIFGDIRDDAVLIHSDFWPGNIHIDPQTYRVNGVIDPLDAEWAHNELDLIFLDWSSSDRCRPLDMYARHIPLPDGFALRRAFYRFWYRLTIMARIEWREPDILIERAKTLDEEMRDK